jgi:hypothetical protein
MHESIPILGAHLSDEQVADRIRMLLRTDLDHEAVCLMARDRILALSQALEPMRRELDVLTVALQEARDDRDLFFQRATTAESKLHAIMSRVQFVKEWLLKFEGRLPEPDPVTDLRRSFHSPVHKALDEALAQMGSLCLRPDSVLLDALEQLAQQVDRPLEMASPVIGNQRRSWLLVPTIGYFHGDDLRECLTHALTEFVTKGHLRTEAPDTGGEREP